MNDIVPLQHRSTFIPTADTDLTASLNNIARMAALFQDAPANVELPAVFKAVL